MKSITIITIVVVALLTAIIFGLTWLAYASCLKMYKKEVDDGEHDEDILNEYLEERKNIWRLIGSICSYLILFILIALFIVGFSYKIKGNNFVINNKTILVIKTGSMSDFYDDKRAKEYNNDKSLQFDIGDICIFETNFELKEGEVYGYKYNNSIITHRLITYDKETGLCEFRGDNNNSVDTFIYGYIRDTNVVYHYTGHKIKGVGAFILYAQSYFGIMSLVGIIGVFISSEIVNYKIDKINKDRLSLWATIEVEKDEE